MISHIFEFGLAQLKINLRFGGEFPGKGFPDLLERVHPLTSDMDRADRFGNPTGARGYFAVNSTLNRRASGQAEQGEQKGGHTDREGKEMHGIHAQGVKHDWQPAGRIGERPGELRSERRMARALRSQRSQRRRLPLAKLKPGACPDWRRRWRQRHQPQLWTIPAYECSNYSPPIFFSLSFVARVETNVY